MGIGAAIKPDLGILIALAIVIDNLAGSLSIGELIRSDGDLRKDKARRILGRTGMIGVSLLGSALVGWAASVYQRAIALIGQQIDGADSRSARR